MSCVLIRPLVGIEPGAGELFALPPWATSGFDDPLGPDPPAVLLAVVKARDVPISSRSSPNHETPNWAIGKERRTSALRALQFI